MNKNVGLALRVCCLALLAPALQAKAQGAINLDTYTFDKIVDGSRDVLVKFDQEYAYGDAEDAFKALCKTVGPLKGGTLIAEVGVQDYGEKENTDVAERFGASKGDFPVYKLFKKGGDVAKPVAYTGEKTEAALSQFLKAETGLYIGLPGNLEAFDKLAAGFLGADGAMMTARLAEAEAALAAAAADDSTSAKADVKIMKRVQEKGVGFVEGEVKRVKKLIGGKITDKKKKFFNERLNILASFTTKDEL